MSEVLLLALLTVSITVIAVSIIYTRELGKKVTKQEKELNKINALEMKCLEPFGLDTYYPQYSIHALSFPHKVMKEITFYHPEYLFKLDYDFNHENTYFVQGSYVSMQSLLAVAPKQLKANVKILRKNVKAFQEAHNFQDIDLRTLVPLMYIFGDNPQNIRIALESEMHPAIIAVLVNKEGEHIVGQLKEMATLPIEWLSNIYEFAYITKNRESFKFI